MSDPCASLELYHHRGLDPSEVRAFEAHLAGCVACLAELESFRQMDDLLRASLSNERGESTWDALEARVRRRIDGAPATRRVRPARRRGSLVLAGAAAAAALVIAAVLLTRAEPRPAPTPVARKESPPAPEVPAPASIPVPAHESVPDLPVEKPASAPAPVRTAPPKVAEAIPAPPPDAASPPKPAPPSRTVAVRARLERVKGVVTVSKVRASEGQEILSGQEVQTEGAASLAVLAQADARFELGPESRLSFPEARAGAHLTEGRLTVEAPDRAAGEPAVCTTAHASVRFLGARFSLTARAGSTLLEVHRESAEFVTLGDGTAKQVREGQLALALGQDAVDQRRVDEAIRKGVEFLKTADSPTWTLGPKDSDELILLTLIDAGVAEGDPKVQSLLKKILEAPLESTYEVAVQAMALEEIHRVKYQPRIAQCAQFLVDNQCKNGQWGYGKPTVAASDPAVPTGGGGADTSTAGKGAREFDGGFERRQKPKVQRKVSVRRTREGPAAGDNSNSQYAALGLRACHDAGVVIPKDVIQLAKKWWVDTQIAAVKDDSVATGGKVAGVPQGWCYRGYHHNLKYCKNPDQPYSSMTAGAVGALTIYDFILGVDWKKDKAVQNGLAWLARNWSWSEVAGTPEIGGGKPKTWLLYYYYALERVGMLYDTPKIGDHDWYAEGATVLLEAQKPNGSWLMSAEMANKPTWDTCFAILFLKRATRPLDVASEDRNSRKPAQDNK